MAATSARRTKRGIGILLSHVLGRPKTWDSVSFIWKYLTYRILDKLDAITDDYVDIQMENPPVGAVDGVLCDGTALEYIRWFEQKLIGTSFTTLWTYNTYNIL